MAQAGKAQGADSMSVSLVAREADLESESKLQASGVTSSVTSAILKCEERLGGEEEEEVSSRPSAPTASPLRVQRTQPASMSTSSCVTAAASRGCVAGTGADAAAAQPAAHTSAVGGPQRTSPMNKASPTSAKPAPSPAAKPGVEAGASAKPAARATTPLQPAPASGAAGSSAPQSTRASSGSAVANGGTRATTPSSNASCSPQAPSSPSSSDTSLGDEEHHHMHTTAPRAWVAEVTAPVSPATQDNAVGLLYDGSMELHKGPTHAEHPARITAVAAQLESEGLLARCWALPGRAATDEHLLLAHDAEHITKVDGLYASRGEEKQHEPYIDYGADLYVCKDTAAAARMAAGCCVSAVQAVLAGGVQSAFAVVRPPGHHAECERAQGFCFFNNCAVAARVGLLDAAVKRVLVIDWDVHHGNGIQHVLWHDPRVLYISIHRHPKNFYPYNAGFIDEVGAAEGEGFNINIPWVKKGMGDADYAAAFELVIEPVLSSFDPQLVIVAAGFDAARGDPLGGCNLSPEGYASMTRRLTKFANGRVVVALEGGYNTRVTAACAAACVRALLGEVEEGAAAPRSPAPTPATPELGATAASGAGKACEDGRSKGVATGKPGTTSGAGAAAAADGDKPWKKSAKERAAMAVVASGSPSGAVVDAPCLVLGSDDGTWPSGEAIKTLRQVCEVQAQYWPALADFEERWQQYEARLHPAGRRGPAGRPTRSSTPSASVTTGAGAGVVRGTTAAGATGVKVDHGEGNSK